MSTAAPDWFRNAVIDGVTLLYALALRGAPPAEVVPLTTTGWIDILWRQPVGWDAELDEPRLRPAFTALAGSIDAWPAPRSLLAHLPPRLPPVAALPEPVPPLTPERRAMFAALRRRVTDRLTSQRALRTDFLPHGRHASKGIESCAGDGTLGGVFRADAPATGAEEPAGGAVGMS